MGTQIQGAGLTRQDFDLPTEGVAQVIKDAAQRLNGADMEGCNEALVVSRPDLIEDIHRRYFAAGSDIVETNTFGSSGLVLADYDIPELDYELSKQAAIVARRAADQFENKFVAGALGPGTKLISLGQANWDEMVETYQRCFVGLIEGGVDVLMLETLQDLLMVKAGVVAAKRAMAETETLKPVIVQVTMEQTGTMLVGSEIGAALNMLECFPEVVALGGPGLDGAGTCVTWRVPLKARIHGPVTSSPCSLRIRPCCRVLPKSLSGRMVLSQP